MANSDDHSIDDGESSVPFEQRDQSGDEVISSIDPEQKEKYLSAKSNEETKQQPPRQPEPTTEPENMPILSMLSKSLEPQRRFQLQGARCIMGRKNSDLQLNDPFVSDWHAQLYFSGDTMKIQDMNSKNGVYLRISDQLALEDGDEIVVGQQHFKFHTDWADNPRDQPPHFLGAPVPNQSAPRLLSYKIGGAIGNVLYLQDGVTLGQSNAEFAFSNDEWLDTPHLQFQKSDDKWIVKDLDTDAGTFIRIQNPVKVLHGDCILLGQTRIQVSFPDES